MSPRPAGPPKTKLGWYVRKDLLEAYEQWCRSRNVNKVWLIETLIEKELKVHGVVVTPTPISGRGHAVQVPPIKRIR